MTNHQVAKVIKHLKNDCSTKYISLHPRYLKLTNEISSPLTHIIDACIDKNIFPQNWKISRLSPVPKANDQKDIQITDHFPSYRYCQKYKSGLSSIKSWQKRCDFWQNKNQGIVKVIPR